MNIKMSSTKTQTTRKKLRRAERERARILSELLGVSSMLRGSYARVYTKCGKDNCWCKDGKGHPHSRITWSQRGQGFTRKVPPEEVAWVREVTENYRNFRSLRRRLLRLQADGKELLDKIENDLVKNTRKGKRFLRTDPPNRRKNSRGAAKTEDSRGTEE